MTDDEKQQYLRKRGWTKIKRGGKDYWSHPDHPTLNQSTTPGMSLRLATIRARKVERMEATK